MILSGGMGSMIGKQKSQSLMSQKMNDINPTEPEYQNCKARRADLNKLVVDVFQAMNNDLTRTMCMIVSTISFKPN